jgi:hypothetical protein
MRHIRERFFFWCVLAFASSAMPLSVCVAALSMLVWMLSICEPCS